MYVFWLVHPVLGGADADGEKIERKMRIGDKDMFYKKKIEELEKRVAALENPERRIVNVSTVYIADANANDLIIENNKLRKIRCRMA
jgi:hypothetical protein